MSFFRCRLGSLTAAALVFLILSSCGGNDTASDFQSRWREGVDRVWVGPDCWANRLQDWRVADGRLECRVSAYDRYLSLLTRDLGTQSGNLEMSLRIGRLSKEQPLNPDAWAGFRIGAKGRFQEYRDTAIRGRGLDAGITMDGRLFLDNPQSGIRRESDDRLLKLLESSLELRVTVKEEGGGYAIRLSAHHPETGEELARLESRQRAAVEFEGGLGLVSHFPRPEEGPFVLDATPSFWFSHWEIRGTKLTAHPERAFGPVLFAQYTLSDRVLKLTAQMPPLGDADSFLVKLLIQGEGGGWTALAEVRILKPSFTATFRIPDWDSDRDIPYRLVYALKETRELTREHEWKGTIRKEPWDKQEISVAAFTGNNDLGFPNTDVSDSVKAHNPDLLFFSGDNIYEGVGGRGVQRSPVEQAAVGYLGKWYQWGWAYQDLIKDRPTICIPDDHDVYHGNLWGAGGKACSTEGSQSDQQDSGGYKMPAWWVNMVQRTQTSHLPDPYDPTPVLQGITVYYTAMNYAGISFAILEDRKFKSAPRPLLPEADIRNGWPQNRRFNAEKDADAPGAQLLGDRQLAFLEDWSADWSEGTWMKAVLSQTIFANIATLPEDAFSDAVVPRLRILPKGAYAENDKIATDLDSNGWPQTGRNRALRAMRKGFALHIAGDQHLGSTIGYGVDDWNDSGFALCVPSVSNVWPRRWYPPQPGRNRKSGSPKYTGGFKDGFGNKITVYAVSNPTFTGKEPSLLYDRATGFGLVRFHRATRDITIECWPRLGDPNVPENEQYPGWPVKLNQKDNYGKKASAWLPTYRVSGIPDPVFQIIQETTGEIVYTLRIAGDTFTPKVFSPGTYTVRIGEPGTDAMKVFKGVSAAADKGGRITDVRR